MYPHVVSYLHDVRAESWSVASDMIDGSSFSVLAGLLACGLLAALLIRPVAVKHFMGGSELAAEQEADHASHAHAHPTDSDHGSLGGGVVGCRRMAARLRRDRDDTKSDRLIPLTAVDVCPFVASRGVRSRDAAPADQTRMIAGSYFATSASCVIMCMGSTWACATRIRSKGS